MIGITCTEYHKIKHPSDVCTLEELIIRSRNNSKCEQCGERPVWKLADCDLCFTCTTGETDSSRDYELIEE